MSSSLNPQRKAMREAIAEARRAGRVLKGIWVEIDGRTQLSFIPESEDAFHPPIEGEDIEADTWKDVGDEVA